MEKGNLGILERVTNELGQSAFDALLVVGNDHVQYLSGAHLPFLYHRPDLRVAIFLAKNADPVYICPEELATSVRKQSSIACVSGYVNMGSSPQGFFQKIQEVIQPALSTGTVIGIDEGRIPSQVFDGLQTKLGGYHFLGCDDWLKQLRVMKTPGELALLKEVAYTLDHAINARLHHTIASQIKSMVSLSEDVRTHTIERGLDEIGYHSTAQSAGGGKANKFWPACPLFGLNYGFSPAEHPQANDLVRISMNASFGGYWSSACRILIYGKISDEQTRDYQDLLRVHKTISSTLKAGKKCCDIYRDVVSAVNKTGISLVSGFNLGHSVGVSFWEAPFIGPADETVVQEGMIFVLDPIITNQRGQVLRSKDTVIVGKEGCEVVNWWKDWREPYTSILYL
jgi:Xaa-Pro dipeptidase